ncbi:lipoprotein NlpI [Planctobacterium marinum]|uniref:lipoprotein NlpI n=1 Tax=Planctobacterium marinum TaxID=1631968 RepID=UPI001E4D51AD|nr:lipoprotein NlpI [Planctobacterium marinum]MCC2605607.1 lipoprotein NlpI [Planctobacterium marinum]
MKRIAQTLKSRLSLPGGLLVALFSLSGCAVNTAVVDTDDSPRQMGNLLLAEPAPASFRSQMALARLNQVLTEVEQISDEQRAELLYQRGTLYDSVGLRGLAQYDFDSALKFKPDMAEAHNFIGIHHTQNGDFIQAYDAFDSTLEIQPDHDFALLNRGIALYYGGRPELAVQDLALFYQKDRHDPYRALWHYIIEREIDKEKAGQTLQLAREQLSDENWATQIVDFYLGKITENQLLAVLVNGVTSQEQLTDRLCEAYFYLGKYHSANDKFGKASNYFKLTLSTNVYQYVEHRYARLELNLLREQNFN